MPLIQDYTDAELKEELERREKENSPPEMKIDLDCDFQKLRTICREYVRCLHIGEIFIDPDIFKSAMETLYSPDIWNWINETDKC